MWPPGYTATPVGWRKRKERVKERREGDKEVVIEGGYGYREGGRLGEREGWKEKVGRREGGCYIIIILAEMAVV